MSSTARTLQPRLTIANASGTRSDLRITANHPGHTGNVAVVQVREAGVSGIRNAVVMGGVSVEIHSDHDRGGSVLQTHVQGSPRKCGEYRPATPAQASALRSLRALGDGPHKAADAARQLGWPYETTREWLCFFEVKRVFVRVREGWRVA